ncbi:sn-glycerol-3-phosphate transporter [Salmonella enterica subsp. arizonae]|uniref:sn-glycerol-3-phosphate transporter n=1 Tax=Salmonella enterica subsp. arizonae TaxID=59203 RepID=A0A379SMR7_SALER|nr:sn-glycerol-3-phosphate transporter [Salmonella enterica subsp. arizonae]
MRLDVRQSIPRQPWRDGRILYDPGHYCDHHLLDEPGWNPTVDMICMIVIGFLIYGPVMLIGLHALELAPKKAAGTAAGFTGLFGYLGGSVAASAIVGYTVDFFGWDGGFMVMIGGSILAVILLVVVMIGENAIMMSCS